MRKQMKYQLTLQFAATKIRDFDDLAAFEELLRESLLPLAIVDGHDLGRGEWNIFILTDAPTEALEKSRTLLEQRSLGRDFKAAYRELTGEDYVILWPVGLKEFVVS